MARFMVECLYPTGPRRILHVTSETMPTLEGVVLRDGSEIKFRGILWNVTLHPEPETARWVLEPAD